MITPSMLLYGRKLGGGGTLSSLYVDNLLEDSKYLQKILPHIYKDNIRRRKKFWEAFQADYLNSLRLSGEPTRCGDLRSKRISKEGDLIMLHDKDARIKPKMALILETLKSDDGGIRSCKVRIGTNESIRPVSSFRDLELNVYDAYQHQGSDGEDHKISGITVDHLERLNGNCIPDSLEPVDQEKLLLSPVPQKVERSCKVKARHLIHKHYS